MLSGLAGMETTIKEEASGADAVQVLAKVMSRMFDKAMAASLHQLRLGYAEHASCIPELP